MRVLATALLAASAASQPPAGAIGFRQACLDAGTDAVVMNVAAHPDDEAARSMVYLRRTLGVRTVALFSTCGEGGQNAVGRDIGEALARRRVLETIAAAEHTDTQVRWLGFPDFGFSKSLDETLRVWGADRLRETMLQALRELAPDIVLTNHDTVRGHGHHRASAWAIEAAVQIYAKETGRVVPLYQRPADEKDDATFALDVSRLDPVAGRTFARQAHEGLLEHASQGPWGPHDPARVREERWKLVWPAAGAAPIEPFAALPSMLDDASFARACSATGVTVDAVGAQLASLGDDRPRAAHLAVVRAALESLARLAAVLAGDPEGASTLRRLQRRREALERAWLHGHGVSVEAYVTRNRIPLFGHGSLRVAVAAENPAAVEGLAVTWQGLSAKPAVEGALGELVREIDFYLLPPGVGGDRDLDPVTGARILKPRVSFTLAGLELVETPRVRVLPVPELTMAWDRDVFVLPQGARDARRVLSLELDYHGDGASDGALTVEAPPGVTAELRPARVAVSSERRDARALLRLHIEAAAALPPGAELVAHYGVHTVALPLRVVDLQVPKGLRVGLVRGPDDTLLRTLQDLGIEHTELDERALAVTDLGQFTTLAFDMRTGGHRADLRDHRDRIAEFAAAGGRVLFLYHKPNEWNARPGRPALAPYELTIGNERVAEEDAAVEFLAPDHPLLRHPHRIDAVDFMGWVQERGLNFPDKWGPEWTPLLRMHDLGEEPLDGALLVAAHGEGSFVFCSLALYRQWREGHAGALRMLVNLLNR